MKKTLLLFVMCVALASAALAQTPMQTLQAERQTVGTPMSDADKAQILNATALKHGMFLLAKSSGVNCPLPGTGEKISCDWLVRFDGWGWDVFADQETEGRVVGPDGDPKEHFASERLITPFGVAPNPTPTPPTTGDFATRQELERVTSRQDAFSQALDELQQKWNGFQERVDSSLMTLDSRLGVLEARPMPVTCHASVFGIGIQCKLQ